MNCKCKSEDLNMINLLYHGIVNTIIIIFKYVSIFTSIT